jgi:hypothetical protein
MISKVKIAGGALATVLGILAVVSMVGAQSAALSVSCAGAVANNVVTWTATATGGTSPYVLAWSGDASVAGDTSTSIEATYSANGTYTANIQATDASSTVATSTCQASVTSIVTPTPPTITPASRVNPPTLSIGPNGSFLARGMTVISIGTDSFQASVWGITYTVNWSGASSLSASPFEFWFRHGRASATSTPTQQLAMGDEVGVSGAVASSSPLIVNASVVRDYSITAARPASAENTNSNERMNSGDARSRLNDLLNQLKGLQQLFRGH